MANIFTGTEAMIKALPRPEIGEFARSIDTNRVWNYTEKGWVDVTDSMNLNVNMSLYEMNKQIVAQLPDFTAITEAVSAIDTFVTNTHNCHYMMYGKEISYFTIFQRCSGLTETVGEAVIDCLGSVGTIKSIDPTPDGEAFEIWVMVEDNATCLYLFPYDTGIVQVGG